MDFRNCVRAVSVDWQAACDIGAVPGEEAPAVSASAAPPPTAPDPEASEEPSKTREQGYFSELEPPRLHP